MYAKLFSRITESSIIEESITTRWVFVALLAIADLDGTVIGTDIAIARRINVPLKDFEESMKVLMSPDKDSNNKEFEGRRILPSEGERGYFLTGYATYRSLKTEDERRNYMKEYMAKRRENVNSVNSVNIPLAQLTHTEASTDSNKNEDKEYTVEKRIISYLNEKSGRSFRPVKANVSLITARLKEGFDEETLKGIVDVKCAEWLSKPDYAVFLRPETLFAPKKCASYAGQVGVKPLTDPKAVNGF